MPRSSGSVSGELEGNEKRAEGEEYSASACAILQRSNSWRRHSKRNKKRPSMSLAAAEAEAGRPSVYTVGSADTAISMEEGSGGGGGCDSQEQIFEELKLHKEVLSGVKQQPWPLDRKVKLVRQAKAYVRKHEGVLQERLAQSHSTRDAIARISLLIGKKWQYLRRELVNLQGWLVPWEVRIKEIESHFGSAVASYFIFLRWLFWINLVIAGALVGFVGIPEVLTADVALSGERKVMSREESVKSRHLLTLWEFEGVLKYSPMFYGYYTNRDSSTGYRLPLAYFVTNLVVYTYSFVAILRKMAVNSRMSKLTEKEDECVFSWKLFTGWDFMIGNPETAHNRVAGLVLGLKEALVEEAERQKDDKNWRVILARIFVNVSVMSLLALSAYAVVEVVARSTEEVDDHDWWRKNEITIVMSLISYVFPIFFEILGILENYHPRKQLRMQLARIMVLNLLNLYSLIFALFDRINDMEYELDHLKPENKSCRYVAVACERPGDKAALSPAHSSLGLASLGGLLLLATASYASNASNASNASTNARSRAEGPARSSDSYYDDFNATLEEYVSNGDTPRLDYEYVGDLIVFSEKVNRAKGIASSPGPVVSDDATTSGYDAQSNRDPDRHLPRRAPDCESGLARKCFEKICATSLPENLTGPSGLSLNRLDAHTRQKLRRLCWETTFGQELAKLTLMDLVLTIVSTLTVDFARAIFVRIMNNCWCWDLEKQFPQYGDFKIAENILHLVYNQGMVWMGMFFSPGLTVLNIVKLGILLYLRSWAVLTCNVPHEVVFRASRSNNFYFALLLTMLFLCVLPVGYAIVWVEPSWHCGPFSGYRRIYNLATEAVRDSLPGIVQRCLDYAASPGIVIPLIVLMALIIYYMASLTGSLREANNDLKLQLRHERTEERRKLFEIVGKRRETGEAPFARWKKILPILSSHEFERSPVVREFHESFDASGIEQSPAEGETPQRPAHRSEVRRAAAVIPEIRINEARNDSQSRLAVETFVFIDPHADGLAREED